MKSRKTRKAEAKKKKTDDMPTVEVPVEYLRALRRAVGRLIDPETVEVISRGVHSLDPYGDYPDLPLECQQVGCESFVRDPGTDVWIYSGDLPMVTYKRLCKIHSDKARNSGDQRKIRYHAL